MRAFEVAVFQIDLPHLLIKQRIPARSIVIFFDGSCLLPVIQGRIHQHLKGKFWSVAITAHMSQGGCESAPGAVTGYGDSLFVDA